MPQRSVNWRKDETILARLPEVERRHLRHQSNRKIAEALKLDETTIRRDLERIRELWRERVGASIEAQRAQIVAELDDTIQLAHEAYEWDKQAEAAVLYGDVIEDEDGRNRIVQRDHKGSAQFRGGKAQALTVRERAIMDKAKVLGVVVEKQEQVGEVLVRVVERESRSPGD